MSLLTDREEKFVEILRSTVIFTAAISLLITFICLIYAAYAQFLPEPKVNLSDKAVYLARATDPKKMLLEVFPENSQINKDLAIMEYKSEYSFFQPTDKDLLDQFNKFLDTSIGASFEKDTRFYDWISGPNAIDYITPEDLNNTNANNQDNARVLMRSLLYYYAVRLNSFSSILHSANQKKLYPTGFDGLTSPTSQYSAPYFLYWFFIKYQDGLAVIKQELDKDKTQRNLLKYSVWPALQGALAAFGYFISIMFLFLFISIEASVRRIAENSKNHFDSDKLTLN